MNLAYSSWVSISYEIDPPFTAEISLIPKKYSRPEENKDKIVSFKVISIRNFEQDFENTRKQVSNILNERVIIISHSKKAMKEIRSYFGGCHKFTYDDELLLEKLEFKEIYR